MEVLAHCQRCEFLVDPTTVSGTVQQYSQSILDRVSYLCQLYKTSRTDFVRHGQKTDVNPLCTVVCHDTAQVELIESLFHCVKTQATFVDGESAITQTFSSY